MEKSFKRKFSFAGETMKVLTELLSLRGSYGGVSVNHGIILVQLPFNEQGHPQLYQGAQSPSSLTLDGNGISNSSLGNLFQCLTTQSRSPKLFMVLGSQVLSTIKP